jgi:hypothetical protein
MMSTIAFPMSHFRIVSIFAWSSVSNNLSKIVIVLSITNYKVNGAITVDFRLIVGPEPALTMWNINFYNHLALSLSIK